MTTHEPKSPPAEEEDLPSPRSAARQVLIVEDDRRLRDLLLTSIREMDMVPSGAPSAEVALRMAEQQAYAVAVIDLNLPGMSGLDLCRRLHAEKPLMQLIILTGFGDLDAARQAIRLEVIDFLTKPCGMEDLEQALGRASKRWLDRRVMSPMEAPEAPMFRSPSAARHESPTPLAGPVDEMERELIFAALARHQGNRQAAATELRISIRKLYYRLQQYQRQGLMPSDE